MLTIFELRLMQSISTDMLPTSCVTRHTSRGREAPGREKLLGFWTFMATLSSARDLEAHLDHRQDANGDLIAWELGALRNTQVSYPLPGPSLW